MEGQYTSLRIILDKILRHPLLQDISIETVADYTVDFMRIMGVPSMFEEKVPENPIEVVNHRGLLPCDIYQINQVRYWDSQDYLRYATDTFHLSTHKGRRHNNSKDSDGTFMVQGDYIITSKKDCKLEISYISIKTDEDGFPMIPDNSSFYRALQSYIKKEWFGILFDMGSITQAAYEYSLQDYAWAVGACQTEFNKLDLSKAESLFNSFRTLIIRSREFSHGWRKDGSVEILKHN